MPRIDLGDITLDYALRVKGQRRYKVAWHLGAPIRAGEADRAPSPPPYHTATGRIDVMADLMADQKAMLQVQWTDEVNNPVDTPPDASESYTVDDPAIVALSQDADGKTWAAATGTLGIANVHGTFSGGGQTLEGDLQIVVVAGLASRANLSLGTPEEVTPDI